MLRGLDGLSEDTLARWIEDSIASGQHQLARGYQGQTLLYQDNHRRLVVKVPAGRGVRKWISTLMLRHESRVYARLTNFPAAPQCYGLLRNRYLILEYIDGEHARHARIADRETFFAELLEHIKALHALGIAHSDLQKQDNILLVGGQHPLLLDFGAAVIRKPGFAPLNHAHYRFAARLDFNQWVKFKYRGRYDNMNTTDQIYYRRTAIEKLARSLKNIWRSFRS